MKKYGLGVLGEQYVSDWMEAEGYTVLARNFSGRFGEIDIVAKKNMFICFVEVKTRGPSRIASPMESVTYSKQQKIVKTAQYYMATHKSLVYGGKLQPRFDCAEVFADETDVPYRINYIENAF